MIEKRPIKFSSRNSSTTRGCTELCAHKGLVHKNKKTPRVAVDLDNVAQQFSSTLCGLVSEHFVE